MSQVELIIIINQLIFKQSPWLLLLCSCILPVSMNSSVSGNFLKSFHNSLFGKRVLASVKITISQHYLLV